MNCMLDEAATARFGFGLPFKEEGWKYREKGNSHRTRAGLSATVISPLKRHLACLKYEVHEAMQWGWIRIRARWRLVAAAGEVQSPAAAADSAAAAGFVAAAAAEEGPVSAQV